MQKRVGAHRDEDVGGRGFGLVVALVWELRVWRLGFGVWGLGFGV